MFGDHDHRNPARYEAGASRDSQALVVSQHHPVGDLMFDREQQVATVDLAQYWRILLKHRWLILATLVASVAIAIGVTLLMTPIYRAEATLQIDREAAKVVNVQGVEPTELPGSGDEFFLTQYGLLKSRALALRVVDVLNLGNPDFFKRMGVNLREDRETTLPREQAAQRRVDAVKVFQRRLGVAPVRGSRLVRITFESPDPALAAQIVNATAENFISSNLDRRFESSSYARQFLEERLAQVKTRLEESERQVVAYATKEEIINVPTSSDLSAGSATQSLTAASLVSLNSGLSAARGERIKAEGRYRQALTAVSAGLSDVLQNPTVQELRQTRAKLQAEYSDKLQVLKPDHPEMLQLRARSSELERQLEVEIINIQGSLKNSYEAALLQEQQFENQVNRLKGSVLNLRGRSIQYEILQREVDTNRTLYDGLLQRYKEIGVAGGVSTNNISIVDRAEPPAAPAKPKPLLNIALAAICGLGLGVMLAFLLELLDESISTPEDVESKLGVALLGSVPKLDRGESPVTALNEVRSAFSEAYYSIRTALQFSTAEGAPRSVLVTSARPAEGKSTTALALAKNFARLGLRVLLVDGDLRNPSMHRAMGAENNAGFSNLLTGMATISEVAQKTDLPNFHFIPCGPLPPNPAELLAGKRLHSFLEESGSLYEIIVIDGPPVMGLADAPMLASAVAGTVFAIEAGGTRRGLARTAIRRLHVGRARILGAVLTKFNAKKASYGAGYAYAYSYEYGSRPQAIAGKR